MAGALAKVQAGKIRIEVVTPTGIVLSEVVDEFTAPSVDGEFGVLPGHVPLLAALRIGLVSYRKGAELAACAVGSGFVEVADDYALLLTDKFMSKDKIDVVKTRLALKEVDEKLSNWTEEPGTPKHQEVIAEEQWQVAILTLFGDPPPPVVRGWEEKKQEEPKAEDKGSVY